MASDLGDDIRYVKLILLLVKGGTFLTKNIVLRILSLDQESIDDFLKDNEDILTNAKRKKHITEKQMQILFPGQSTPTDLERWDISLYSHILLNLFGHKFDSSEKAAIEALRETRNELAHSTSTTVSKVEFLREWERLTMAMWQLKRQLLPEDQDEYNSIIDQIYTITDFHVAAKELKPFENSDDFVHEVVTEKLKSLEQKLVDCCDRVGELETSIDEIKRQHVIMVRIFVSALTPFAKDKAQAKFLETLKNIVSGEHNDIDVDEVLTACNNLVSEMRKQGVDIVKVEEGSILVTFRCPTIAALKNITTYFAKKMYEKRLKDVENALGRYLDSPVKLDMNIVLETLYSALEQIDNDVDNKPVMLTCQCQDSEAIKNVCEFFSKGSSTDALSKALSSYVGEEVNLHSTIHCVDVPKAQSDITEPSLVDQLNQLKRETLGSESAPLSKGADDVFVRDGSSPSEIFAFDSSPTDISARDRSSPFDISALDISSPTDISACDRSSPSDISALDSSSTMFCRHITDHL